MAAVQLLVDTAEDEQDIPSILFVLSDMQFNDANSSGDDWGTGYDRICQIFEKKGYSKEKIPLIIFWNLRGTDNFVVSADQ